MTASSSVAIPQETTNSPDSKIHKPLTIKQLKEYPESARKIVLPAPTSEGRVQVGGSRGRPFGLHYEIYGSGPARILFLCGHGDQIRSWHRQISRFCVPYGDKYTSLFLQHRGVMESEGPFGLWSMKDLAADAFDLLNGLHWTEERSVHVVGHSMGGMEAQELAMLCPSRVASLTFISTTYHWKADLSLLNSAKGILSMFVPQNEDQKLAQTRKSLFGKTWPDEADTEGLFPTNGDNWAARDYLNMDIPYYGAILQIPACVGHRVKPEDLKKLAQDIGGSRIQVMHGRSDNMAPFTSGQRLYEALGGDGSGVQLHALEDTGHILPVERFSETVEMLEAMIASTSSTDGK